MVTQPRRFPCQSLFGYVEKTFGQSLCGWKVAGAEHQASNPLVYVTDGLLREQLIALVASPPSTPEEAKEKLPYDVIVLDEIHERSFNMDMCIAAIAKLLSTRCFPHLRIVLASATLDPDVIRPLGGRTISFFLSKVGFF